MVTIYTNKVGKSKCARQKAGPKRRSNVDCEYIFQFWTAYVVSGLNTIYTNKVGKSKCARQKAGPKKAFECRVQM